MDELDIRDLACPGPVLKLRELLDAGEREIRLWVADELCRSNVVRFAGSRAAEVEAEAGEGGTFHLTVRAGADSAEARASDEQLLLEAAAMGCALPPAGPTVVQVTADTMGTGDDELGGLLLRSFLKTQLQLEKKPDLILFYNGGVRLCCSGSLLLDDLRAVVEAGVEILACGTCLNYFELADRLEVGRVTDMLEIATRLAEAGTVVRP